METRCDEECEAKEKFIPSKELSYLYIKLLKEPEPHKKNEILKTLKDNKIKITWEDLVEETRLNFIQKFSERMHSIFIFFAQKMQEANKLTTSQYSEKNRFSDKHLEEMLFLIFGLNDLTSEKLIEDFIAKLFSEFTAFLSQNQFQSKLIRAYVKDEIIYVDRLYNFPFPDYREIFESK